MLEEGHKRKVIFSTFDPDCATLLSLKCARYPVFFLTCAGSKHYADPRMNSLEAALIFAKSSKLQVGCPAIIRRFSQRPSRLQLQGGCPVMPSFNSAFCSPCLIDGGFIYDVPIGFLMFSV